ncbi:MAG: PQQ-binding-like beta-propeller repeat protein [Planctomycetes bacterium]|nr:PQQ-binding-like beta-propeller repeat protein [Planctomycetota bacterium]
MNKTILLLIVLACAVVEAPSAEVYGWRKDWTGRFPEAQPPEKWSKTENVVWACALPAWSNANPVLVGDRIFICSEPDVLVCVSKADGKILWQQANPVMDSVPETERAKVKEALDAAKPDFQKRDDLRKQVGVLQGKIKTDPDAKKQLDEVRKSIGELDTKLKVFDQFMPSSAHVENGHTSATPVTDGKVVFAVFNNGVMACYDMDGKRMWMKYVEKAFHDWGNGTSPVLAGDMVVVHFRQMVALKAASGEEVWRAPASPSFGTPVVVKIGAVDVIIDGKGDFVRASDGKILAKGKANNSYNGPLVVGKSVYFIDEGGAKALELPAEAADTLEPKQLWAAQPKRERYYGSPVYHDGFLYAITRFGDLSVLDAKTGEVAATKVVKDVDPSGQFYPSIALAGKNLYIAGDHGKSVILEPGKDFKEIARNELEPSKATAVFEGTRMYVRGRTALYCIGK